jgi:hypothetical protein
MVEIPADMLEIKQRVEDDLLARPGVVGVAVGLAEVGGELTGTLAIKIYVEPGHGVRGEFAESFEGYPVNVVERKIGTLSDTRSGPFPLGAGDIGWDAWTYDPLVGGISISPCVHGLQWGGGTLGAIVIDNASGHPMLLSNYHVLAAHEDWQGTPVIQPYNTLPCVDAPGVARVRRAVVSTAVDAAVAMQTGRDFDWEIVGIGSINGTAAATVETAVRKRGMRTRLTAGKISSIHASFWVEVGGNKRLFKDQIEIHQGEGNPPFADQGDSGSVVVDGSQRVLGLVFAVGDDGVGYANHISEVTKALDIAIPSSAETLSIKNKTTLEESTSGAPVLATAVGRPLVMTWSGATDRKINFATSTDGKSFAKTTLDVVSFGAPAIVLAPAGSDRPDYMAWTGNDHWGYLHLAAMGPNWSIQHQVMLSQTSSESPGLAVLKDGTLLLAWKGSDSTIQLATSTDGGKTFSSSIATGQAADSGPVLTNIDGTIYLLTQGTNWWPFIREVSPAPLRLHFPTVLNTEGSAGPASLERAGQLVLAWRGSKSSGYQDKITVRLSRTGMDFARAVILDENTASCPSLCRYDETLYLAWTSLNYGRSINVAELSSSVR